MDNKELSNIHIGYIPKPVLRRSTARYYTSYEELRNDINAQISPPILATINNVYETAQQNMSSFVTYCDGQTTPKNDSTLKLETLLPIIRMEDYMDSINKKKIPSPIRNEEIRTEEFDLSKPDLKRYQTH